MSVVGNWKKEAERFTPGLPVLVHHGQKRTRDAALTFVAMTLIATSRSRAGSRAWSTTPIPPRPSSRRTS